MSDNPDNSPLVERLHKAEHIARELSEHLRQAFLPKLHDLRSASKVFDPDDLLVLTGLGSLAGTTIQNAQLYEQLHKYHCI